MSYDKGITLGMGDRGVALWTMIRDKCPTHNDVLAEMNARQRALSAYAKEAPYNSIQGDMLQDIQFLETIAWRMYMYGVRRTVLTAMQPTDGGEFRKRMRNDPAFHKLVSTLNIKYGTVGCEELQNSVRMVKLRCLNPACTHKGVKKATKALKAQMRQEWDRDVLKRYKY